MQLMQPFKNRPRISSIQIYNQLTRILRNNPCGKLLFQAKIVHLDLQVLILRLQQLNLFKLQWQLKESMLKFPN
jgi:hypothetical protein